MQNIITQSQGVLLLIIYGLVMVGVTFFVSHKRKKDTSEFLLADRGVGVFMGAVSIAAAWIWAPALFVAAQKSFEQGIAGAFWFIFPNFLALLVFAPFALRVRKILPKGYTFPQFIKLRHGKGVHFLYMIQFLVLQICSFAVQILAGATLIKTVSGLPFSFVVIILVVIVLIYAMIGGLRASVATDYVQMGFVLDPIC